MHDDATTAAAVGLDNVTEDFDDVDFTAGLDDADVTGITSLDNADVAAAANVLDDAAVCVPAAASGLGIILTNSGGGGAAASAVFVVVAAVLGPSIRLSLSSSASVFPAFAAVVMSRAS